MPRARPLKPLPRQRVLLPPARPPVRFPTTVGARRGTSFIEQDRKHILQQKDLGKTRQAVADEVRCSEDAINRLLKDESEVPGRPSYVLKPNDKLIISRFKEGKSLTSIAHDLDLNRSSLWSHFHRYLVPSDYELSAKIATHPKIDAIVKVGLLRGKTAQQMARENRQSIHAIQRHVWRYQTPTPRTSHKVTPQDREQILALKQAGQSANEISLTKGFAPSTVSKIIHEEFAKREIPREVRRLAAKGKDVMQIVHKTKLSLILVRHFVRRLSKEGVTPEQKIQRKMRTRWTKSERERLIALWNTGAKPDWIALELVKSTDQVYRALWRWRSELTRAYEIRSLKRWTADEISRVLDWRNSGMSFQEIAKRLPRRSMHGIRSFLQRHRTEIESHPFGEQTPTSA